VLEVENDQRRDPKPNNKWVDFGFEDRRFVDKRLRFDPESSTPPPEANDVAKKDIAWPNRTLCLRLLVF